MKEGRKEGKQEDTEFSKVGRLMSGIQHERGWCCLVSRHISIRGSSKQFLETGQTLARTNK